MKVRRFEQPGIDSGEDAADVGLGDDAEVEGLGLAFDVVAQIGNDLVGLGAVGREPGAVLVERALERGAGGGGPGGHGCPPTWRVLRCRVSRNTFMVSRVRRPSGVRA